MLVYRASVHAPPDASADLDSRGRGPAGDLGTLVPALAEEQVALARIARSRVPVLLRGETGTGKEVTARRVHALSGSARGALVAVNCGAIPDALVESQLFGHAKGAFSGAVRDEPGFVRAAAGGTLLLDEIGDLPPTSQAALLRVLQEGEVVPVGSTRPVAVDLRVVAATHQPLEALVARGAFRSDLLGPARRLHLHSPAAAGAARGPGLLVADLLRRRGGAGCRAAAADAGAGARAAAARLAAQRPRAAPRAGARRGARAGLGHARARAPARRAVGPARRLRRRRPRSARPTR